MSGMTEVQRANQTHVECFSPPAVSVGAIALSLSLNGGVSVLAERPRDRSVMGAIFGELRAVAWRALMLNSPGCVHIRVVAGSRTMRSSLSAHCSLLMGQLPEDSRSRSTAMASLV